MEAILIDITMHKLVEHDALEMASHHLFVLQDFRDHIVHPSITSISKKLCDLSTSEDKCAVFQINSYEELKNSSIQAYIIAVQSMWERGFRAMLTTCESIKYGNSSLAAIKSAKWSNENGSLQDHFQRLIGISIRSFASYDDLNLLLILANGIRHGDGPSAKRLYSLCPSLWPNAVEAEQPPPFSEIVIPAEALHQTIKSVLWFWEDIENIRCNSFKQKVPKVERGLSNWRSVIDQRGSERVWNY